MSKSMTKRTITHPSFRKSQQAIQIKDSQSNSCNPPSSQSSSLSSQGGPFFAFIKSYIKLDSWITDIAEHQCSYQPTTDKIISLLNDERLHFYRSDRAMDLKVPCLIISQPDNSPIICSLQPLDLPQSPRPSLSADFNLRTHLYLLNYRD